MNRQEIREKFRAENPEITDRVVTDSILNDWMLTANDEICCVTRCIVSNESEIIASEEDVQFYDLEAEIEKFLDLDDMPGGGVYYDDVPLTKTSAGEMNRLRRGWKTSASGTPRRYWRRGKYLWLDVKPDDDDIEIAVDCVLRPDDFDDDAEEPFNGLGHLQAYCDVINKYLQWRSKEKVGKDDEGLKAFKVYEYYLGRMSKLVRGGKFGPISIKPADK